MAQTNVQAFSGDVAISSNLAVDTNTLFVDSVGNNVGIGKTNPGSALDVVGTVTATTFSGETVGTHYGTISGSNTAAVSSLTATTITSSGVITCNANKMIITGDSPTLYLRDSDSRTGMIHQNENVMYFLSGPANSDAWAQTANDRWPLYIDTSTNQAVFGGNIDANAGTVSAATITATGNVGIGTVTPNNSLHVYKAAGEATSGLLIEKASGTAGTAAALLFGTSAPGEATNVGIPKGGIFFERTATNGRGNFQFCLDNVDNTTPIALSNSKMTITSDGKVGIGVTSPDEKLEIVEGSSIKLSGDWSDPTAKLYIDRVGDVTWGTIDAYAAFRFFETRNTSGAELFNAVKIGASGIAIGYDPPTYARGGVDSLICSGNVGIGKTNPGTALDVVGTVTATTFSGKTVGTHYGTISGSNAAAVSSLTATTGTFSGTGPVIDCTAGDSGDMISKRFASADRYGMGQYSLGATRLFTSTTYGAATIRLSGATNDVRTGAATFTDYMTVKNNGNVGIGTTDPKDDLHIFESSTGQTTGLFIEKQNGASGTAQITFGVAAGDEGSTGKAKAGIFFERTNTNGRGEFHFCVDSSDDDNGVALSDVRMAITNAGNVGIGTNSPDGTLHVKADNRVHITAETVPVFTGLEAPSQGRAQLVLNSSYSDLVIASSVVNDNHGSTLSFATVNPSNTAEYRKFVINQGNWGSRKDFLDFGLSASTSDANPHLAINSTDTVLTLDGNNKRVGIGRESPDVTLDVNGTIKTSGGLDLPDTYGYCGFLLGTGDGAGYSTHNVIYKTWWGIGVRDYGNICRIHFDSRSGNIQGTGSVNSTSDDRIKINEKRITRATDTLSKLDPQVYHKTNQSCIIAKRGEHTKYLTESGLIAQDIWYDTPELRHLVLPGTGADPAIEKPHRNPDITIDPDYSGWGPEPATLNYTGLIPYLIKSVQEITTELPNVKTCVSNVNVSNVNNYRGLIVSANKPDVYISTSSYDTNCYGVVSEENIDTINNEILVNTSRDGKVWVINGENLQSGDYITTSNVAGYGMKQSDDLVHNYTVAKILQGCDFNPTQVPVKRVKRETRDVTYYVNRVYSDVPGEGLEAYIHDNKIVEIDEVYYTKNTTVQVQADADYTSRTFTPEITEEAYDALDESDRVDYVVGYFNTEEKVITLEYDSLSTPEKEEYEQKTRKVRKVEKVEEVKEPIPGYKIETRTEEVDVLDSNGQLVWEETGETRASYTIKNVDAAGIKTDEANTVHIAAFVKCKVVL